MEILLSSLGMGIGKSNVYRAVQAVTRQVPGLQQEKLVDGYKTKAVEADMITSRCNGVRVIVGITVDVTHGMVLSIDDLPIEDAEQLKTWLAPIMNAVEAHVLVSDDANAFKKVSDETGRTQQGCKSHLERNTDALVAELTAMIDAGQDASLDTIHRYV